MLAECHFTHMCEGRFPEVPDARASTSPRGTYIRKDIPEMHRLGSNRAIPELRKATLLRRSRRADSSTQQRLPEQWAEVVEDAGARAERHVGGCIPTSLSQSTMGVCKGN
jgi:hypothetical protein